MPLAAFGALHWGLLVEGRVGRPHARRGRGGRPGRSGHGRLPAAAAAAATCRGGRAARSLARAIALVAAGVPARLLWPGGWGELSAGISQGLQTLPDVRVPYVGVDAWPRIVILGGAALLVVAVAAATFWPVRGEARPGHATGAALLCVLYAVPAVDLTTSHQFLRGAAFAALLAGLPVAGARAAHGERRGGAWRWARRWRSDSRRRRRSTGPSAWVDYEKIAESFAPAASVSFDFSHRYGPLDWPRDGREVLRVKAAPRRLLEGGEPRRLRRPALAGDDASWRARARRCRASCRPTSSAVASGASASRSRSARWTPTTLSGPERRWTSCGRPARPSPRPARARTTFEETLKPRRLLRGRRLRAAPDAATQMAARRHRLPGPLARATSPCACPLGLAKAQRRRACRPRSIVRFPRFGSGGAPPSTRSSGTRSPWTATSAMRESVYRGRWALARRLRRRARARPYEYVRRVVAYLSDGFAYSESPLRHRVPLESFLFDERSGTASSSRARWRCCCAWAAYPPGWPAGSRPAASAPSAATTSSATSTPTPGSRCGSRATAG